MSVGADHETCAEGAARALSFASFGDQRRDVRRGVGEKLRLSSLDDLDGVGSWIRHGLAQAGGIRGCARPRSRCLGASRSALSLRVRMIGPPPERLPMSLSGASPCLAASLEAAEIAGVLLPAIASAADEEDDPAHPTAGFPGRLEVSAQRLASVTWSIFWTAKTTSKMVCRLEHVTGGLELDTPGPALSPRCLRHCEARREKRDLMAEPRRIRDAANSGLVFTTIRRFNCGCEDEIVSDRDVSFVAVEAFRPALSSVAHLSIAGRNDAIRRDTLLDPRTTAIRVGFGILGRDLSK